MFRSVFAAAVVALSALSPMACSPIESSVPAFPSWAPPKTVSFVGDSLTAGSTTTYAHALEVKGVTPVALSGVASRALRNGWQCVIGGRLVLRSTQVLPSCKREGLEEFRFFASKGLLGDAVVLALGTNDARAYGAQTWVAHLNELRQMIGSRPMYVVTARTMGASLNASMMAYDTVLAWWCAADQACRLLDWASTIAAQTRTNYLPDGIHLVSIGTIDRANFIAQEVIRLSVPPLPATTTPPTTVPPATTPTTTTTTTLPPAISAPTTTVAPVTSSTVVVIRRRVPTTVPVIGG